MNFNNLHTDDVEATRAFYGSVFGWTTIDAGSPMWALPGYGDHLEELNPGLRAGMKQTGAPEGCGIRCQHRRGPGHHPAGFHQVGSPTDQ